MAGPERARRRLSLTLIGDLRLADGGHPLPLPHSRKTRALFVYLLLSRKPVRRERLCEIFFDIPNDPRAALRWSLTKIRTMLGRFADALHADRERVELDATRFTTDAESLRDALARIASLDAPALRFWADKALESPLAGLDLPGLDTYAVWLAAERAELDALRAAFLTAAAGSPRALPEQRHLYRHEAGEPEIAASVTQASDAQVPLETGQHVHYCFAPDGVRIAYACTGEGAPLVKAANWLNHLELDWTGPIWGRLFAELSEGQTLIRYDERGNGLSSWDAADISFEAFVHDLETVVDHLGLDRFPLLGISQGAAVSIEYAARHPSRVTHLILLGGYAAGWRHVASPEEQAQREAIITLTRHGWGADNPAYRQLFTQTFIPSATPEEMDYFNRFQRETATPENAARFLDIFSRIDVRHRLSQVHAPTLVLHARGDQRVPLAMGVGLASSIPGAALVTLDTDNHIPLSREPAAARAVESIRTFISTPAPPVEIEHHIRI